MENTFLTKQTILFTTHSYKIYSSFLKKSLVLPLFEKAGLDFPIGSYKLWPKGVLQFFEFYLLSFSEFVGCKNSDFFLLRQFHDFPNNQNKTRTIPNKTNYIASIKIGVAVPPGLSARNSEHEFRGTGVPSPPLQTDFKLLGVSEC